MKEEPKMTPFSSNIIKKISEKTKNGTTILKQFEISDELYQQYYSKNDCFPEEMLNLPIIEMQIMEKKIDVPLPWYKKVAAKLVNIKTEHQFLMFQVKGFLVTVDFYLQNEVVIRMGDQKTVLQNGISLNRENSVIAKEANGLEWKTHIEKGQLKFKDLIFYLEKMNILYEFSQASHNGSHFSRNVWADVKKMCKK